MSSQSAASGSRTPHSNSSRSETANGRKRGNDATEGTSKKPRKQVRQNNSQETLADSQKHCTFRSNQRKDVANACAAFKPRPISDADDAIDIDIPPPPSEKKPARRRQSTAAKMARIASPAPSRLARQLSAAVSDSEDESIAMGVDSVFTPGPKKTVPHLTFKPYNRPRPSVAPPPSPGRPRQGRKSVAGSSRSGRMSIIEGRQYVDSVQPVPVPDTPVHRRKQESRKRVTEARPSLGLRGQRGSTSFGRGEPTYPHSSVRFNEFYRHIPVELPDPVKVRWLVSWCAKRAYEEHSSKGKVRARDPDADRLLGDVIDLFVANVAKGDVDTNIYDTNPTSTSTSNGVRPHERNVDNRATKAKEEGIIKRMKAEDRDWSRIAANANAEQDRVIRDLRTKVANPQEPELSGWFADACRIADDVMAMGDEDIGTAADFTEVEYEVDTLHQSTHQAAAYAKQARQFLDGIYASLASDLRKRDAPPGDEARETPASGIGRASSGGTGREPRRDPIHMLRALAAADTRSQTPDTAAKAASVAVAPTPAASTHTPRRPQPATTPRRAVYGQRTPGQPR